MQTDEITGKYEAEESIENAMEMLHQGREHNSVVRRLKGGAPPLQGRTIFRALNGMMLWLQYDEESDGIIATNQEGEVLTQTVFAEIREGLERFFDFYDEESIVQFNAEQEQRREERRRADAVEKPKRKIFVAGYVYLIRAENGLYKIGKAKNVTTRLKPFHVDFPMKWELVHTIKSDDYTAAEAMLHETFKYKRDVGEWFKLEPEDVEYIMSLQDGML